MHAERGLGDNKNRTLTHLVYAKSVAERSLKVSNNTYVQNQKPQGSIASKTYYWRRGSNVAIRQSTKTVSAKEKSWKESETAAMVHKKYCYADRQTGGGGFF